jgi:hypothetical protein
MTQPIITKEEFCKIINQIQEQRKKTEKFSDALEEICDGFIVFDSDNKYLESLLYLLSKVFSIEPNSQYNTIDWYLFEGIGEENKHEMSFEGLTVNITTPEMLYELLLTEKANNEDDNLEPTREFFKKYGTLEEGTC